jgi:hypothetical protein
LIDRIRSDYVGFAGEDLRCFFDLEDIHAMDDWRDRILGGLRESNLFVLVLSPAYLESPYCEWEIVEFLEYEHSRAVQGQGVAQIYFVEVPGLDSPGFDESAKDWLARVRGRNHCDLRPWFDEGAAALERADVQKRLDDLERSLHVRLTRLRRITAAPGNLPAHNPRFVGRESEMQRLHRSAGRGRFGVLTAVHGVGGLGKTALEIQYAYAFADFYPGGRWLMGCAGRVSLAAALRSLDLELGVSFDDEEKRDDIRAARRILRELHDRAQRGAAARAGEAEPLAEGRRRPWAGSGSDLDLRLDPPSRALRASAREPCVDPVSIRIADRHFGRALVIHREVISQEVVDVRERRLDVELHVGVIWEQRHGDYGQTVTERDWPDIRQWTILGAAQEDEVRRGRKSLLHGHASAAPQEVDLEQVSATREQSPSFGQVFGSAFSRLVRGRKDFDRGDELPLRYVADLYGDVGHGCRHECRDSQRRGDSRTSVGTALGRFGGRVHRIGIEVPATGDHGFAVRLLEHETLARERDVARTQLRSKLSRDLCAQLRANAHREATFEEGIHSKERRRHPDAPIR